MSLRNKLLTWALRRWIKPKSLRRHDIVESRALTGRVPFGAKLPKSWRIRAIADGGLIGEWIEPADPRDPARRGCILYLHGGGYVAMSPLTHRALTSRLASWSDTSLFALDYRLAPEHKFPAAIDDAVAAFHALVAGGLPPSRIVVAGDSAGGGLALALLLKLRDLGSVGPAACVLFSPWTDLAVTGQSVIDNDAVDPLFFGAWIPPAAAFYLGDTPAMHPLASPLYADLTGLPPLLFHVGDTEVLLDDSRRLADRARAAGVKVELSLWHGVPHGWQIFAPFLPEARESLREASDFIRAALGSPAP